MEKYAEDLRPDGSLLLRVGVERGLMELPEHTGVIDVVGRKNVFPAQPSIGASLDDAENAARWWLSTHVAEEMEKID